MVRTSGSRTLPGLARERQERRAGFSCVAGVDEVGRGSWAGPLVAAAVILPVHRAGLARSLHSVCDSKQLTAHQRDEAFRAIVASGAQIALGWSSHHIIDQRGLSHANHAALWRAVQRLPQIPDSVLVDHFTLPQCHLRQTAVTRGDAECLSIAAASVVAKVVRDRWMTTLDRRFPEYGFARHKGYGTAEHRSTLERLGPSPVHRLSFAPVAMCGPCRHT